MIFLQLESKKITVCICSLGIYHPVNGGGAFARIGRDHFGGSPCRSYQLKIVPHLGQQLYKLGDQRGFSCTGKTSEKEYLLLLTLFSQEAIP